MSGVLIVIGNFDGVHRGHRAVLESALREADERGLEPKLLTFVPHPAVVLGRSAPALLTRPDRKRELVGRISPKLELIEARFDLTYAGQSPLDFAQHLRSQHDARRVVVGKNFRFGKDRAGDVDTLAQLGARIGFSARSEPLCGDETGPWSSTRIRSALARGDLAEATHVLGRPHMLSGRVVEGKRLGRTLGFPTCNLDGVLEALPPIGIYAVLVDRCPAGGPAEALAKGALSIGRNPTTDGDERVKIEVNLFDVDRDLYGETLRVHLVSRLRDEEKFADVGALVRQMTTDVARARDALTDAAPDPATGAFG